MRALLSSDRGALQAAQLKGVSARAVSCVSERCENYCSGVRSCHLVVTWPALRACNPLAGILGAQLPATLHNHGMCYIYHTSAGSPSGLTERPVLYTCSAASVLTHVLASADVISVGHA